MNGTGSKLTAPSPLLARRMARSRSLLAVLFSLMFFPFHADASLFQGEALDTVADVMSWVVLAIVPIIGIGAFWLVHILPEKIAEKKQHPQTAAIQTLCLLSLVFGGILWPLAWLWAYSKPVMYKMAYGTDKVPHGHDDEDHPSPGKDEAEELKQLRARVAELENKRAGKPAADGGKV